MSVGSKKIIPLFSVATVCAVFLRVIQITLITEPETGFFLKGYELIGNLVTAAIMLFAAVTVIYTALYKGGSARKITVSKPFAVLHFILAAAIIYETLFAQISDVVKTWQILLQIIFGILSAIVFAATGYYAFSGKKIAPITQVIHIIFWLVRVIIVFSSYISVSTIAENIFELAALCTGLVFFLNSVAYDNEIDDERISKRLLPSATAAVIMGAVYSVSQIIIMFTGKADMLHSQTVTFFTNMVLVAYIVYYVVLLYKPEKKKETTDDATQLDMLETIE